MTTKAEWEKAKADNHAYYPKTFEADGLYTHATGVPSRLIETANHFYQGKLSTAIYIIPLIQTISRYIMIQKPFLDLKTKLKLAQNEQSISRQF